MTDGTATTLPTPQPPVTPTPPATPAIDWRAALWRGVRGFVSTLVALIGASAVSAFVGLQVVPINFSNPGKTATALLVAFFTGFLLALGKAVRDKWGNPDGTGTVNKLVI